MSIVSALVTGGVLGVRHALEADHLAAVVTLVDDDQRPAHSASIGTSWGIGHSLPIVVVGLGLVLLGIKLPPALTRWFEALAGLVLIYLGIRIVVDVFDIGTQQHTHGNEEPHTHLTIGNASLGRSHLHIDRASFLVGMLHGLAGTGALVIILVSATPGLTTALAFLAAFSVFSIGTMGVVTVLWHRSLNTTCTKYLQIAAGCFGVGIGALLLVKQLGL